VTRRLFLLLTFAALAFAGEARADGTYRVLGEFTPSASLPAGALIEHAPFEDKARFTRGVMNVVPLDEVAALFGFGPGQLRWAYRSGGYQGSITPNVVATLDIAGRSPEAAAAFALAWMYVYRQDAVPFLTAASRGNASVRVLFTKEVTPEHEKIMFRALAQALGEDAGYTRTGDREIEVIDFRGNPRFAAQIAEFGRSMADSNPVASLHSSPVRATLPTHDWSADPEGAVLLSEIAKTYPGRRIGAALIELAARYDRRVRATVAPAPAVHALFQ